MPEGAECDISGQQAKRTFDAALESGHQFVLEGMFADATKSEANHPNAPPAVKDGLVYALDPSSTVKRGQNHHQNPIYPPQLRPTAQEPQPPSLSTLELQDISYTPRAVLLHFRGLSGGLFFMLQYLTHTSVQFYPRKRWELSIRNVSKTVRKFSIGVAFVFKSHVLAFPSIDLVFQPTWATSLADFSIPPNIHTSTDDYLVLVAGWIENLLLKPKHTRACDAIRTANTIFYGIGVYTVMELFFMAGLSPCLTLHELFGNPSRAARFLAAFYAYMARAKQDLWKTILQPCIHDGVLAPTNKQRLRYGCRNLTIPKSPKFGAANGARHLPRIADNLIWVRNVQENLMSLPRRMADLVDEFNSTVAELGRLDSTWGRNDPHLRLFDPFEPSFIASAFEAIPSFGPLIFGEVAWLDAGGQRATKDDPLTVLYRKFDLLSHPTMLRPEFYTPLTLPREETRGKRSSHRPTFTFHDPKELEMWSITNSFPPNSHWSSDPDIQQKTQCQPLRPILGRERQALLLKNIVESSLGVSIGPLEYCGVGHVVHIGGVSHIAVCKGDPMIPEFHERRVMSGLDRVSSHLEAPGKRKRGRSDKENEQLEKKLSKLEVGYRRAGTTPGTGRVEVEAEPKLKRRRLSADQKLALLL
ncbi:hypothetical protein C8R46DRAFT_1201332 [Mycena filopes]|nr:hypothetical protein C8R46DRAFT_1201332 [Mycena filopes]